jgi:excisionase family DNA binding protein
MAQYRTNARRGANGPESSVAERLLSVEEVAEWLAVPVGTVYAWRYRGCGPASYKVGRHVRFRREDVEAWLADQRTEPLDVSLRSRLLGVVPARNPDRKVAPTGSRAVPTRHLGKGLGRNAIAGVRVLSPLPDPTPASCMAGVGEPRQPTESRRGWR